MGRVGSTESEEGGKTYSDKCRKKRIFYTKWRMCIYKFHLRYIYAHTNIFITQTWTHSRTQAHLYSTAAAAAAEHIQTHKHTFRAYGCGQIYMIQTQI